jgi:hypothetical protein
MIHSVRSSSLYLTNWQYIVAEYWHTATIVYNSQFVGSGVNLSLCTFQSLHCIIK